MWSFVALHLARNKGKACGLLLATWVGNLWAYSLFFDSSFFVVVFLIFRIFLSDFFLSSVLVVETPSDCSLFLPGVSLGSKKEFAQLQEGVLCETIWTCQVSCTQTYYLILKTFACDRVP